MEAMPVSVLLLALIFAVAAGATWVTGIYLSRATDRIDVRFGFGEAIGGMVLLAIAGSLPELAVTVSGALQGNLGLVAGNLVGGIAMQTVVLVLCDFAVKGESPLTSLVGSLIPVIEGALVIMVVSVVPHLAVAGVSPASIVIVLIWVGGILVINRARKFLDWKAHAPGSQPGRPHRRVAHATVEHPFAKLSTATVLIIFGACCVATLIAGVALEVTGNKLADHFGINGVVFGATVMALATALPEISTGISAVKLGDHQLVMGDVFGGNAFQVCLFPIADLIAGRPVLPAAGHANSWLGGVGVVLTGVYAAAIIVRPKRRFARLGLDSIMVLGLFAIGVVGLLAVAK
jgi:cation:H+ antiporter